MYQEVKLPFLGKCFDLAEASRAEENNKTPFNDCAEVQKDVVYKEINGQELLMDVYIPKDKKDEVTPAVMIIPGGGWMVHNRVRRAGYASMYTALGIKVFVVDYRTTPNIRFPENVKDLVDALDYIYEKRDDYKIDVGKVVITGDSAGGHLAACLACTCTTPGYAEKLGTRVPIITPKGCIFISASFSFKTMCRIPVTHTFIVRKFSGFKTKTGFRHWELYNESYPWNCVTENFPKSYNNGGSADPFCTGDAKRMADRLTAKGVKNEYFIGKGRHCDHCYVLRMPYSFARRDMLKIMIWYKNLLKELDVDLEEKFIELEKYLGDERKEIRL